MNQEAARKALEGKAFYPTWQGMLMVRDNELLRLYHERVQERMSARCYNTDGTEHYSNTEM